MVVVGGVRGWCLVVLSCGDVGGSDRSMWLAVGAINCKDYELKRERIRGRENVRGEK